MLTNVATALIGIADIWVIGQLGDAAVQGAVELGAKLLMGLLVVFNFLRTGTIGLTAQAVGRIDEREQAATLTRAVAVALLIGAALLLAKPLAVPVGLELLDAHGAVEIHARTYVDIRYWGAPVWLVNAALVGWLIGRRKVRAVLVVEVATNIAHVGLDIALVLGLDMGITGVAVSTLAAEATKLLALAAIIAREAPARRALALVPTAETWNSAALGQLFRVNRDLFLRTLVLTLAFMVFTRLGAGRGATILAANGILFQLFMLSALILDGFESAAQVLCGEAVGSNDRTGFDGFVRANLAAGLTVSLLLAVAFAIAGGPFAASFSTDAAVVATTLDYFPWAIAMPIVGVVSFVLDGVFIGATWTRAMLVTMTIAFLTFAALLIATASLGNHGLWLSFTLFFVARAAGQALVLPRLADRTLGPRRTAEASAL